jgi:hypothetical protein
MKGHEVLLVIHLGLQLAALGLTVGCPVLELADGGEVVLLLELPLGLLLPEFLELGLGLE